LLRNVASAVGGGGVNGITASRMPMVATDRRDRSRTLSSRFRAIIRTRSTDPKTPSVIKKGTMLKRPMM
jgi:hypothetical protein